MKNSSLVCSSLNKSDGALSHEDDDGDHGDEDQDIQEEESGWTAYFDDFFTSKAPPHPASRHINSSYDDDDDDAEGQHGSQGGGSMCCSPSMVSDAASCAAAWKTRFKNDDDVSRRAKTLAALSSFDGAQMVVHKKLRLNKHKKFGDYYDDSLEDTASSPVNSPKAKGDDVYDHQQGQNELKQQVENANRTLKNKGLCLVPYSLLVNYIG